MVFEYAAATQHTEDNQISNTKLDIHSSFSIFAEAIGAGASRDARAFFFLLACAGFLSLVKRGEKNRQREREREREKERGRGRGRASENRLCDAKRREKGEKKKREKETDGRKEGRGRARRRESVRENDETGYYTRLGGLL